MPRGALETFLERHGPDAGRIFPVWMSPTDDLLPPLDDLSKYKFWYQDKRKQPRTRRFPDVDTPTGNTAAYSRTWPGT